MSCSVLARCTFLPSRHFVTEERTLTSLSPPTSYRMMAPSLTQCQQGLLGTVLIVLSILLQSCSTLPEILRGSCHLLRVVERNLRHRTQDSRMSWRNKGNSSCSFTIWKSDNSNTSRKRQLAFIFQYLRVLEISSA